jgi:hypothetical protein
VFDNFLMKFKDQSIFIHKQLVRFLTEGHLGITLKDLVSYLEKIVPKDCDPQVKEKILPVYELFLARVGSRINEQNAQFLYQWMEKFDDGYAEEVEEQGYSAEQQSESQRSPIYESSLTNSSPSSTESEGNNDQQQESVETTHYESDPIETSGQEDELNGNSTQSLEEGNNDQQQEFNK